MRDWWDQLDGWQKAAGVLLALATLGWFLRGEVDTHELRHVELEKVDVKTQTAIQGLADSVKGLVEYQQSDEAHKAEERAMRSGAEVERKRVKWCLEEGRRLEDCL